MKTLAKILFAAILSCAALQPVMAQNSKAEKKAAQEAEIKQLIQSKNFVFKAQYVFPINNTAIQLLNNPGSTNPRYLNSNYDLTVTPDTVTSYLPYFGEAYFAVGYNSPSDNGIKFTSTNFEYVTTAKKNGSSIVTLRLKDAKYTNQMILTITANGTGDLSVISANRQSIRFYGFIEKPEKPKMNANK
ncbi:DUF4251 domain-containing protein [Mucilaginibacter pedocola]|uniref:DUF4251 domain-containing protein n=1 Tax=Mucilaginibacter pedocola TaxID=1792845 RepID=A0A1S9PM98_9SPHI|nr:DUF4251 domain-containing protein [Mucilaginibacter pedocola]OOQ62075.1 hypothetical protein BC343_03220 [Mucilaginibacter pedocola]